MQLFQQEIQIQSLTQQLQFYMQKSLSLENNLGAIEQSMRQEMEYEIETIRQAFEELETFGEDEEDEEGEETEVAVSSTV
jgi:predicted transcriptional regulator